MLYTKYRINFKLHKNKVNKNNVIIRVTSRGSREDLYTGITVTENQWDENRERIKHGCSVGNTTYNIINATLDKYSKFINEYFSECAMRDVHPSLPELKKSFNKKFKRSDGEQSDEFSYYNYMDYKKALDLLVEAIDDAYLQVDGEYNESLAYPVADKVMFIKKMMRNKKIIK